jgi:hypothetical protein
MTYKTPTLRLWGFLWGPPPNIGKRKPVFFENNSGCGEKRIGILASGRVAGQFDGNVTINGTTSTSNLNCARQVSTTTLACSSDAQFNGPLQVTGTIFAGNVRCDGNLSTQTMDISGVLKVTSDGDIVFADCAEHFTPADTTYETEPGTVVVFDEQGTVSPSSEAYDKKVAGVVSGAGNLRPAIILGRTREVKALPVALVGRVFCKVDASFGPIELGDLLTTSPTPGHAMKAKDPAKALGAIIGKALEPWDAKRGMIRVLVSHQ